MSNQSRLQANNADLQSLINKANALPDAGSGQPETKTVDVSVYRGSLYWCTYTKLDANGNMTAAHQALSGTDVSISGCVVGTTFTLSYNAMELSYVNNTTVVYTEDQSFYVGQVT